MLLDLQHLIPRKNTGQEEKTRKTHTTPLLLVSVAELARWNADCLFSKFGSCEYLPNHLNESGLRLSRGYSKAILDQLPNKQETAVRTDVESRNHVEAIPAQLKLVWIVTEDVFRMICWTIERGRSNASATRRTLVLASPLDDLSSST
ncbi:hypothetical protein TNCV_692661 [Trichonephila clavipes]|nr:hypothetical protein TNCV_692661 [Trichonephila clavipes]